MWRPECSEVICQEWWSYDVSKILIMLENTDKGTCKSNQFNCIQYTVVQIIHMLRYYQYVEI